MIDPALARLKEANRQLTALQILLDDESIPSMPEWVQLLTTDFCNLKCPHCNTHGTEERRQIFNQRPDMPAELFTGVAKEALPFADEVTLTVTGEPLATPRLSAVLDELAPFGAKLNLVTNGTTFNADRLSRVLPIAGWIQVSIDGATPAVLEATRLGAKWGDLLTKIRTLTRAIELLPAGYDRPSVMLAVVAMASNLRDLPWLVRLAHRLGVRKVGVAPIVVVFDHQRDESIHLHPGGYNHWRLEALQEARRLGIDLHLPEAFAAVPPDPTWRPSGLLVMEPVDDRYYASVPSFDSAIDEAKVEKTAAEAIQLLVSRAESRAGTLADQPYADWADRAEALVQETIANHRERLDQLARRPEQKIRYCEFTHRRMYVGQSGEVAPCCTMGRPVLGRMRPGEGPYAVWNSEAYRSFRHAVRQETPPDCCVGCWHWTEVPRQKLLQHLENPEAVDHALTPWLRGRRPKARPLKLAPRAAGAVQGQKA